MPRPAASAERRAARGLDADLAASLEQIRAAQRYRTRRIVESRVPGTARVHVDGRDCIDFCSNDYLGLAGHPRVTEAFVAAARRHGVGGRASHLVSGHSALHHELETALAAYTGRPRALSFSTGYMANLAIGAALLGRGDRVFEDRLNHASLLDAGLASGARFARYPHANTAALETRLSAGFPGRTLVATDGVFSMDGDVAPLAALAAACRDHGAWLMVDDAHGFGVLGATGCGSVEAAGLGPDDVPILMCTLGKALGTFGAFVAGSEALIETLIQRGRTYIYTTALPPAVAAASRAALDISEQESWRRARVQAHVARFRNAAAELGLPLADTQTPIQPIIVGSEAAALATSEALYRAGLWVAAIRPPTVPSGSSRLRITLSAAHDEADVDRLLDVLAGLVARAAPR